MSFEKHIYLGMGGLEVSCIGLGFESRWLTCVAMPFGFPGNEKVILNVDSLWSGGPFASAVGYLCRAQRTPCMLTRVRTTREAILAKRNTPIFLASATGSFKT
jgi:hypothetical protein